MPNIRIPAGYRLTLDDLRGYVAKEREPLRGNYRGYEVISMPPPSSGGAVLIEMLSFWKAMTSKRLIGHRPNAIT